MCYTLLGVFMKIVVFSDLHGSLNSLKALINTIDFKTADKRIFLGDAVVGCSRPNDCLNLLKNINCVCILGNNDGYVASHIPEVDKVEFDNNKLLMIDWMKNNITQENKDFINSWQKNLSLIVNKKTIYFTHYAWEVCNNDTNVIDSPRIKNEQSRKQMFKDIDADYIIFGHEHKTNYVIDNQKHYFCLGTLGLKSPGSYLVIEETTDNIKLEERFLDFDINEEIDLMDIAGYPYNKNKISKKSF